MNTRSFHVNSLEELKNELQEHVTNSFTPTVALGFSSYYFDFKGALELFESMNIDLVGCTTAGEILDDRIHEKTFVCLLMELPKDSYKVFFDTYENKVTTNSATSLANTAIDTFTNPGILMYSGGVTIDGEAVVKQVKHTLKREIPLFGGLAGDDVRHEATYAFAKGKSSDFALCALIIDTDKIKMTGLSYSGWNDLGGEHTITKAEGNILYEIDGKPALSQFKKYFGEDLKFQRQEGSEELYSVPGQYPLKISNENGEPYMRSVLIYDSKNQALVLAGAVHNGSKFRFCPTPDFDVVDNTIERYHEMKNDVNDADAIVMISCKARHFAFGPMLDDEIEGIYDIWQRPTVGFLAYGEIGQTGLMQSCEFHNVTCSLVILNEVA